MATKQFYATGSFKYGTRMLSAGDGPIEMDGPTARLYAALGKISPTPPRPPRAAATPAVAAAPPVETPPQPPITAPAPRRKVTRRKRAAKKAK